MGGGGIVGVGIGVVGGGVSYSLLGDDHVHRSVGGGDFGVAVICYRDVRLEVGGAGIVGDNKHWHFSKKFRGVLVNINTLELKFDAPSD